jgi:hypothetical protein
MTLMVGERPPWTLQQLRAFHDGKAWELRCNEERRGAWAGEREARDAYEATVRLIDRITGDGGIIERLKAGK